jgi:hypothetical protein
LNYILNFTKTTSKYDFKNEKYVLDIVPKKLRNMNFPNINAIHFKVYDETELKIGIDFFLSKLSLDK